MEREGDGGASSECEREARAVSGVRFVLATANPGKISEMRGILSGLGIVVKTREELGIDIEVEETGTTFIENALLKASAICKAAGMPAVADDSGLMVDALGGSPGVYSSSFGGEGLDDTGRCKHLIEKMQDAEHFGAKFVCTIACVFPDGKILTAEGECRGEILTAPRGLGGFGYDPVFLVEGLGKTMAELTREEKNAVSHRGKALREFYSLMQNERLPQRY